MIRHCLEGIDEILQLGFFSTGHIEEQILISGLQKGGKDRRDQHRQVGDQHPCRVLWNQYNTCGEKINGRRARVG